MGRCRGARPLVLVALLLSCSVVSAAAPSLCDFRAPITDISHLFMILDYSYLNLPETPHVDVSSGRFSFTFSHIHDEPDRALNVGSTTELSLDHLRLEGMIGSAYMTTRYYVPEIDSVYGFAEVRADHTTSAAAPGLELRLGAGYGRLTDVTPLARAMHIEDSLIEDMILAAPLSDAALQEIAELIGRESEFEGIGELVSHIANVIQSEARVTLSARSLVAVAEEVRSDDVSQQCGWTAQLGLGYELLLRFGAIRQPLLTVSADIVRPLSLESQVAAHADFSRPILLSDANALSASVLFTRQLGTATRLVAEYALQRVRRSEEQVSSAETIEAQLLFDLGAIDLTASGSLSRGTGATGWVESIVIAVRLDLL